MVRLLYMSPIILPVHASVPILRHVHVVKVVPHGLKLMQSGCQSIPCLRLQWINITAYLLPNIYLLATNCTWFSLWLRAHQPPEYTLLGE